MVKQNTALPFLKGSNLAPKSHEPELWVGSLAQEPAGIQLPEVFFEDHFALRKGGALLGVRGALETGAPPARLEPGEVEDLNAVLFAPTELGEVCEALAMGNHLAPLRVGFQAEGFEKDLHLSLDCKGPFARFAFRPAKLGDLIAYAGSRVAIRGIQGGTSYVGGRLSLGRTARLELAEIPASSGRSTRFL